MYSLPQIRRLKVFVPLLLFSIPSFHLAYTFTPSFPPTDLFLTIASSPVSTLSHFSSQLDSLESKLYWLSPIFSLILPPGSNMTPLHDQMQLTLFVLHLAWLYSILFPETLSWPSFPNMTPSHLLLSPLLSLITPKCWLFSTWMVLPETSAWLGNLLET